MVACRAFVPGVSTGCRSCSRVYSRVLSLNAGIVDEHQVSSRPGGYSGAQGSGPIEPAGMSSLSFVETGAQDVIAVTSRALMIQPAVAVFPVLHTSPKQQACSSEVFPQLRHVPFLPFRWVSGQAPLSAPQRSFCAGRGRIWDAFSDFLLPASLTALNAGHAGRGLVLHPAQAGDFFRWRQGSPGCSMGWAKRDSAFESVHIKFRLPGVGIGDSGFQNSQAFSLCVR